MILFETSRCRVCGKTGEIPMTSDEFELLNDTRVLIQNALPNHSPEQREQVKTGIHSHCWIAMFGVDEE